MHLLIPFASTLSPACLDALASLQLPNLRRLLAQLAPGLIDTGDEQSLSAPHERAVARALGLPVQDGQIAFAAHCAADGACSEAAVAPPMQAASGWAFVTPCHWQMGQDHVRMLDPSGLQLSAEQAQLLRQAMHPYFAEDGIELQGVCMPGAMGQPAALSWLAQGELLRDMACASLDRVSGRELSEWMPQGPGARVVRRLQSEMQMLLYTHPVNEDRQQCGLLSVNSFWVSGCGALPARGATNRPNDGATPASMRSDPLAGDEHGNDPTDLLVDCSLRKAALAYDPAAFIAAWQQLDAGPLQRLHEALRQSEAVQLTLCGERSSARWTGPPQGLGAKVGQWLRGLRAPTVQQVLESL